MQFIDLRTQYKLIEKELWNSFHDILSNTRFIMGKEVLQLEEKLQEYVGVKHCITCASGTDALLIPLMAYGVGSGDAVFVPDFTFYASAEVIALTGATPVFVDVKEDSFNIDCDSLQMAIDSVISENALKPKAVIAVDLFGLPAEFDRITTIASKYNLRIIEDGAQGFGGAIKGKKACGFGNVGATSFFPAKPLGCYGDGGAIFTNDDDFAAQMRSIRIHGQGRDKYENERLGLNGRLDTLQAAVLLAKLKIFDEELEQRNEVAARYNKGFDNILETPGFFEGYTSSWAQYTLKAEDETHREKLIKVLKDFDIPTAVYYPIPLHKQKVFTGIKGGYCQLNITDSLSKRVFSIPMHPYLKKEEQDRIIEIIRREMER